MADARQIQSPLSARFPDMPGVLYVYDFPRWKWPVVRQCFAGREVRFLARGASVPPSAWLVLWGMAAPPEAAAAAARVLRMEDGFLRSVGLGAELVRPMSWVVDGQGMYYDATKPCDLETLLATAEFDDAQRARAARLRADIVAAGLTKYNVGAKTWRRPVGHQRVILVTGQVESDAALAYGAPNTQSNLGLARAVRSAHPDAYIVYKPHPDVAARLRREGRGEREISLWCDEEVQDVPMGGLLTEVDEVHVMTSLAGFEALLREKAVTCHGQPFYAGWGLTRDIVPPPRRGRKLMLDELVAGALIEYPLYLDRRGSALIDAEAAVADLADWQRRRGGDERWWQGVYRFFLRLFIGVR